MIPLFPKNKEREREWFTEKGHGAMSTVMMNTVKQLSVNVKLQVQHLSKPDSVLRTVKAFCRKVASRSWRHSFFRSKQH